RPTLLLLDEPSMGLSPILVDGIFRIIRDINAQGTTILLVEQNARMALRVAHRGYVMQTGRIVLHDTAGRLLTSDLVRTTYLGERGAAVFARRAGQRRRVRPSRSISGIRPIIRSARMRELPHAIVQPRWP